MGEPRGTTLRTPRYASRKETNTVRSPVREALRVAVLRESHSSKAGAGGEGTGVFNGREQCPFCKMTNVGRLVPPQCGDTGHHELHTYNN